MAWTYIVQFFPGGLDQATFEPYYALAWFSLTPPACSTPACPPTTCPPPHCPPPIDCPPPPCPPASRVRRQRAPRPFVRRLARPRRVQPPRVRRHPACPPPACPSTCPPPACPPPCCPPPCCPPPCCTPPAIVATPDQLGSGDGLRSPCSTLAGWMKQRLKCIASPGSIYCRPNAAADVSSVRGFPTPAGKRPAGVFCLDTAPDGGAGDAGEKRSRGIE